MTAKGIGRWVPGIGAAREYRRAWLWPDVRAGMVVTALLIPAGMGYAEVAGLPPETGLYATIVPLIAYAVFGPSRILVLGPDSSLAPIIAAAILPLALGDGQRAVALAGLLAIMVGGMLLLGGILRLGFVTELLSKPIRVGYLNAIALIVIVSQIPKLLGFSIDAESFWQEIVAITQGIAGGEVQPLAIAFGVGSLVIIFVLKWLRSPVPGVLVVVVLSMVVTGILGLSGALPVVGALPQGLPAPALEGLRWSDVGELALPAAGIALVAFADSAVLSRTFAARRGESVNGSQEMAGIGLANIAGGFLGGFPVSASSSRTPVAEQAGSRTQLTGVVGALLILAFILLAPGLTEFLPSATLAAVVMGAAVSLIDIRGFRALLRMDKVDALLSLAAFLGVHRLRRARGHHRHDRAVAARLPEPLVAAVQGRARPGAGTAGVSRPLPQPGGRARPRDRHRAIRRTALLRQRSDLRRLRARPGGCRRPGIHTVILAAEPITDIDTTAVDELIELDDYLAANDIRLVIAEMKSPVIDVMRAYGLTDRFTPDRFASTVGAAVDELTGTLRGDLDGTKWHDEPPRDPTSVTDGSDAAAGEAPPPEPPPR